MKKKEWFKTWFGSPEYLKLYKHRNLKDAGELVKLLFGNIGLPKGSKVLDLACGNGRHSILFAKKGFNVTGIDLSKYLISEANKTKKLKYHKYAGRLKFEIGDMRNINYKNEFDLVVNLFSSFGYFEKDIENERVIKSISKALKTGGYFFFDFLNSIHLKKNLVPFSFSENKKSYIILTRNITGNIIEKNILIFSRNNKKNNDCRHFTECVKLFDVNDFERIFKKHGLRVLKKFGNYSGDKFNKLNSERLIFIAKKL